MFIRRWITNPIICISSGYVTQELFGLYANIKFKLEGKTIYNEFNYYENVKIYRILGFWSGVLGSVAVLKYYNS